MGFEESLGDPSDPTTPELELRALATSDDVGIRAEVAANPSTPLAVLESLVRAENDFVDDCIDFVIVDFVGWFQMLFEINSIFFGDTEFWG